MAVFSCDTNHLWLLDTQFKISNGYLDILVFQLIVYSVSNMTHFILLLSHIQYPTPDTTLLVLPEMLDGVQVR